MIKSTTDVDSDDTLVDEHITSPKETSAGSTRWYDRTKTKKMKPVDSIETGIDNQSFTNSESTTKPDTSMIT